MTTPTNQEKNAPKAKSPMQLQGTVLRRSGDKTVAVAVKGVSVHPMYQKRKSTSKTYLVHDPANSANVGDTVTISAHRPVSRRKRWILVTKAK